MSRRITPTYILLNQITLAAASGSVTFSNIPQNYGDLVLVADASTTASGVTLDIRFNGDTGSNYSAVELIGRSNGVASAAGTDVYFRPLGNTFGTTPFQTIMQVMDYSATDKHKTALFRPSSFDTSLGSYLLKAQAGRWASTSAVTSITLTSLFNSREFAIGSTFSLYGIAA